MTEDITQRYTLGAGGASVIVNSYGDCTITDGDGHRACLLWDEVTDLLALVALLKAAAALDAASRA